MSQTIGIDLGTTSSRVALVHNGQIVVLPGAQGAKAVPSVVAFGADGQITVGRPPQRRAICCATDTVGAFKRFLGRAYSDALATPEASHRACRLGAAEGGDARVWVHDAWRSPEQMSACVLGEMRQLAEAYLEAPVDRAVIGVPAFFDGNQRRATCTAARLAGLTQVRLLNEPTAVALGANLDDDADTTRSRRLAVCSLGAGGFEISIVQAHSGAYAVLSTAGTAQLGGELIDYRIMDWLREDFQKTQQIDLFADGMARQRLKEAAEAAKRRLSVDPTAQIHLPCIAFGAHGPLDLQISLTRSQLEAACQELVAATLALCRQALVDAKLAATDIDTLLLHGGMRHMPGLRAQVEALFAQAARPAAESEAAVACGAARFGARIDAPSDAAHCAGFVRLQDITSYSLGIETPGGGFAPLIARHTPLPHRARQTVSTAQDAQPALHVHVLQGEAVVAADNQSLGHYALRDIGKAPRGAAQFELCFDLCHDGQLDVTAKNLHSRQPQPVTPGARQGLDAAQIQALIDAAAQGRQQQALAALRSDAEGVIQSTEQLCQAPPDGLDPGPEVDLMHQLAALKASLTGSDVELLQECLKSVRSAAQQVTAQTPAAAAAAN